MHPETRPTRPDVVQELERFTRTCRERGLPVTQQRLSVLRTLLESHDHPDAEVVFRSLRPGFPALSLGTVYKTLDFLTELGFTRAIAAAGPRRRYDANSHAHHHLWCVRCQRLDDVAHPSLQGVRLPEGHGFDATGYTIQFDGVCADCRAKGDAS